MLVEFWNVHKALWSLVYWLTFGTVTPTAPVPTLATPEEVGVYVLRLGYTGDPLAGVIDFTHAPEVLAGGIEYGTAGRLAVDCDDVAVLAYACLKRIKGVSPQLVTLRDESGRFGHHVICVYHRVGQPYGELQRGAIDTNGWRELPDATPETLCRVWSDLYASRGYRYVDAVHTPFPF
ncbi:MAG: hypothetical protein VW405_10750 [Rhodospirillaceae bacterium]